MMAVLPVAELITPDRVEFGLCAVGDMLQKSFEIINIRSVATVLNFTCNFAVELLPAILYC